MTKKYLYGLLIFVITLCWMFSGQAVMAIDIPEVDDLTREGAGKLLHDFLTGQLDQKLIYPVTAGDPLIEIVGYSDMVYPSELKIYYVKRGDTLYKLARKFNTTIKEIKQASNIYSDYLYTGQKLYIPYKSENQLVYYVKPGDSLYKLASKHKTTISQIKRLNNLSSNYLYVGQKLIIPIKEANNYYTYHVKAGDSLYRISRNYNTTIEAIKRFNNLSTSYLYVGQTLKIPINDIKRGYGRRINISEGELELLARAVYSEARGEPYKGQVAIAAVIINRVLHPVFPNTIEGVIFQPWQFTAVHDGQFWLRPDQEAYEASKDALAGWDPSGGAVYYYNPSTATSRWVFYRTVIVKIGNHYFAV